MSVSSNLKSVNNGADVLINISSHDNKNMTDIRYSVACSIAHFHMMSELQECDFEDKRKKEQFKNLVSGMLKQKPGVICPLRIAPVSIPSVVPPITSISDRVPAVAKSWAIPPLTSVATVPMVISETSTLSIHEGNQQNMLSHDSIKALILSTLQLELSQRELIPTPIETQILSEISAINKREDVTSICFQI